MEHCIVEGKIANSDRDDVLGGNPKTVQSLKATAMGHAINKYSDEEVS